MKQIQPCDKTVNAAVWILTERNQTFISGTTMINFIVYYGGRHTFYSSNITCIILTAARRSLKNLQQNN